MKHFSLETLVFAISLVFVCCKQENSVSNAQDKEAAVTNENHSNTHAQGFTIDSFTGYKLLTITKAFPGSKENYVYALVNDQTSSQIERELKNDSKINHVLKTPLESIIVTSTTHIPSLEMLGVSESLIGFPGLDYISSPLSRKRISEKKIKEIGRNEALNTEQIIELSPEAVISFGVEGENKILNTLARAQIPVLYNGDWVETHPLGKAEWIKFFGALFAKDAQADSIFTRIKTNYERLKAQASTASTKPSILSGAMYKDVWYVPNGQSWQSQILQDAGGKYLWAHTKGSGSISLSLESVLDKAQDADFWIAPAQFTSYTSLLEDNPAYAQFSAFHTKNIFTFAKEVGPTGGVLYYELAPNRPDLVLADLVSILHPEIMTAQASFFSPLDE